LVRRPGMLSTPIGSVSSESSLMNTGGEHELVPREQRLKSLHCRGAQSKVLGFTAQNAPLSTISGGV
jgi:hypothetical protein